MNDTWYEAYDTGVYLKSGPINSYLLNASFSSSSDTDIFEQAPANYQMSIYFRTQGTASCKSYTESYYGGSQLPKNATVDSYFTLEGTLSTTPLTLPLLDSSWRFIYCTGSSAGNYSIQTDPGPDAKNEYIQFNHLNQTSSSTSTSGLGTFSTAMDCLKSKKICEDKCNSKFLF